MPANRSSSGDWHPQPDIHPLYTPQAAPAERGSYIPQNAADCSKFIIENCNLPDINIYSGLPEAQQGIADTITAAIFEEGRDVVPALQRLLQERAHQEAATREVRWLEVNRPAPSPKKYVVSQKRVDEVPVYGVAGKYKSRVST